MATAEAIPNTLQALKRISTTLVELDDKGANCSEALTEQFQKLELHDEQLKYNQTSQSEKQKVHFLKMSFYRHQDAPLDITKAYDVIRTGADLISATSTKFTLVERIKEHDGYKLVEDLRKGAELIATGCIVLHDASMGVGRSARTHVKQASRGVLATTIALVSSFDDGSARINDSALGAQKTGAVWDCCEKLKKIPQGNRNAMRRDLFQWVRDCNDTMQEFQDIIDLGPVNVNDAAVERNRDLDWDDFCVGADEQYSGKDFEVAQSCLALVKCTRGTISNVLKACDQIGESLSSTADKTQHLLWISSLHELARDAGEGATELGVMLYPPLDTDEEEDCGKSALQIQLETQAQALSDTNGFILSVGTKIDLASEVVGFSEKLHSATENRCKEAVCAIDAMKKSS